MERRIFLAVLLMSAVLIVNNLLFPPVPEPDGAGAPRADSAEVRKTAAPPPPAAAAPRPVRPPPTAPAAGPGDTVVVVTPLARYVLSTRGGAVLRVELPRYPSYTEPGEPVQLVPEDVTDLLATRVESPTGSVDFASALFRVDRSRLAVREGEAPQTLRLVHDDGAGSSMELLYTFDPTRYGIDVRGSVSGVARGSRLVTSLGTGLAAHEASDHHPERELAVVAWETDAARVETERLAALEGVDTLTGPLGWVGIKDKYFFAALVAESGADFSRATARHLSPSSLRHAGEEEAMPLPRAQLRAELPLGADGTFAYRAYLGPLEHARLVAAGRNLQDVNPYGYRWLNWLVRPIAAAVLWILARMHDNLGIAYGWVLIIFGVMMRVVLWPLNAKAMRAQMRNMETQPLLQERMKAVQEKYAEDRQRQQQEMMAVYKELGVNPFSMLSGCLPMLIPMPVLITLFFVFQSAIEFRGASFLWLQDLSLRDPYYILPVFMVGSMFALQWVTTQMSGMAQNPQMKIMMYVMPLMMGIFFWNLASGLNLYYATTNLASIPQQLLIARERREAQARLKAEQEEEAKGPKRPPPRRKRKRA